MNSQAKLDAKLIANRFARRLAFWRKNPLAFVIEAFNAEENGYPSAWQAEALNNLVAKRKVSVASGHGIGKSRFIAWVTWWIMVCHKRPRKPLKGIITGPAADSVGDVAWQEVKLVQGHIHPWLANKFFVGNDTMYCKEHGQLDNDPWFVSIRTARKDQVAALAGFHGDPCLVIFDEASDVDDGVFETLRGAMSDDNSYAVMTGNPVNLTGYFHKTMTAENSPWHRMWESSAKNLSNVPKSYNYINIRGQVITVNVNGRVNPKYITEMALEFGETSNAYRTRVLGLFPLQASDGIIPVARVHLALQREGTMTGTDWRRLWGVDPADRGPG